SCQLPVRSSHKLVAALGKTVLGKVAHRDVANTRKRFELSEFPNLFDLQLRESVAHGFLSSDCNDLGGVIRELGIHRVSSPTCQQIDFTVFTFYPDRQAASDAVACASSVFGAAQIVGDVASTSEHR